jgi:hypothetical protein
MSLAANILDADALLKAAEAATGLSDYGDNSLPARFSLAVSHIGNVGMDAQGQSG